MKTEKIVASIFLVGLIFKLLHWPGAGPLIVVSLSVLSVFYFPLAFYFFCDKQIKQQNLALSIVSGFFLSIIPVGLMFKFQYWPGAQVYLIFGFICASVILALIYYFQKRAADNLSVYYKNMFKRTAVLLLLSIGMYLTPAATLIKIQHWDEPELARLKTQYFSDPNNEKYAREYDEYIMKRDSIIK